METLSELHFDALSEIISIGTSRAAQGLGDVIGAAIQASTPKVELVKLADVSTTTLLLSAGNFGVVTQTFTMDGMNADVMLIFAEETVLQIVRKMMGAELDDEMLREYESEAMCELGNIMIHACLSSIADKLHISTESTLPVYAIATGDEMATNIQNAATHAFILASHVDLEIEQQPIEGKLFFLLDSTAL